MNTVSVTLPDGAVHEFRSPLDPDFAVAVLAGGRWTVRCYTANRRHAHWVAGEELTRRAGWVVGVAVIPTVITRARRPGAARRAASPAA